MIYGNVKAVTKDFTYKADVATFFDKKHLVESEGHIRVLGNKKDFHATMGKLLYDTKKKIAYMRKNIKAKQGGLSFFTDDLEYHSQKKQLIYNNSATFQDEEMTTTSVRGIINTKTKFDQQNITTPERKEAFAGAKVVVINYENYQLIYKLR